MGNLNKMYQWAINTCNAPNVGYSQKYRNQKTVSGVTYYDCSSFVWYALKNGGFTNIGSHPFTTLGEVDVLKNAGWKEVNLSGTWKAGDIVWYRKVLSDGTTGGHTEIVYSGGTVTTARTMGAHGATGRKLADQVSINTGKGSNSKYMKIFRWYEGDVDPDEGGATGYGLSIEVISALCGNAYAESGINAGRLQGGTGPAFGMFQWDGGRRDNLYTWLSANGYPRDSAVGQLEYLIVEDAWRVSGVQRPEFSIFNGLYDFLHTSVTDMYVLTSAFCTCWERPANQDDEHLARRYSYTQKCYAYILAHANDTSITDWIVSPNSLNESQRLNNAVMMYRYFSTGGGGGSFQRHHNMPVWMMLYPFY